MDLVEQTLTEEKRNRQQSLPIKSSHAMWTALLINRQVSIIYLISLLLSLAFPCPTACQRLLLVLCLRISGRARGFDNV